jgi:hypothetical protein
VIQELNVLWMDGHPSISRDKRAQMDYNRGIMGLFGCPSCARIHARMNRSNNQDIGELLNSKTEWENLSAIQVPAEPLAFLGGAQSFPPF